MRELQHPEHRRKRLPKLCARPLAKMLYGVVLADLLVAACVGAPDGSSAGGSDQAKAAAADRPATDRGLLQDVPEVPIGSYGFSRYVYREIEGKIVPLLVEGPLGEQVRCQDEELPCSYLKLKELYDSSAEIPEELHITRQELGELVGQLDALSAILAQYTSIHHACATGYSRVISTQNPNMGVHMGRTESVEFDPANPPVLLFAKNGGERYNRDELGECVGDRWSGDEDYQIVGAVFLTPPADDHPTGFAGPFDNWHLHFNACAGSRHENTFGQQGSRAACEADDGIFQEGPPTWMVHAYAVPAFDNPSGVFSIWNPSIWPLVGRVNHFPVRDEPRDDDGVYTSIDNFSFGTIAAHPGQKIAIANWDGVPHTVTAGTPGNPTGEFDSGALGTGEVFEIAFNEPGEYRLYCTLHPGMTTTVVVK